jgi:F-type H+-transporting ATPase subunit b
MMPVIALVNLSFTLVVQMISFLILLYILNKVLYKPLLGFLDKRAEDIKRSMDEAKNSEEGAQEVLVQARKELEESRREANAIKEQAKEIGEGERKKIIDQARADAEHISAKAKKDIETELDQGREFLKQQAGTMAISIAEKVIRTKLNQEQKELATAAYVADSDLTSSGE